jgi:hypothetical protein
MSKIHMDPYINFQGRAREALEFYHKLLGGNLDLRSGWRATGRCFSPPMATPVIQPKWETTWPSPFGAATGTGSPGSSMGWPTAEPSWGHSPNSPGVEKWGGSKTGSASTGR